MAVTYGFYNSLGKDRVYNAEQMSAIFDGVITDGVFASIGGKLIPTAGSGMQVIVKPGKCWFNSTWTVNDSELPLAIPAADVSLTRIDAIAVQVNSAINTRANSIRVIPGTASANPVKPTLISSPTLHQYALGYVTVPANATSISASNIEVNVGKSTCPFVTSVLQQTNIDDLFNQWNSQFLTWFNNIQSQLSGNVAANLQAQIEAITQDGYGKNGVVSAITISSSIRQLYSSLDTLLGTMNENEEKRILVNVTVSGAWPYSGGLWLGSLRKHGTNGDQMWESATLYSYWKETPVLFFTRDGVTNTWAVTEITKSSDLGGSFRIGDVRQALPNMSAPSADWHECDGTQFDPSAYPGFAGMCVDETTKFNLVSHSSLQKILDDLRPNYVANPETWGTAIYYIPLLQKYYGYTWCGVSSVYGTNYELASELDKCVIFDPLTLTYTVHNAIYTTDMRPSWNQYYGMQGELFSNRFHSESGVLFYNPSDGCFYSNFEWSYYDDDDSPLQYYTFTLRKSNDGYTWGSKTSYNNTTIANDIHTSSASNIKYNTNFFLMNGKFIVTMQVSNEPQSDGAESKDKFYVFKFDTFAYSTLGTFGKSSASYSGEFPNYDNGFTTEIYPVYDFEKKTEEVFIKGRESTGGSSTRENIRWLFHISAAFQCRFITTSFAGSYNVWVTQTKLSSQYYLLRLKNDRTYGSDYSDYSILALASESQMFNSSCSQFGIPSNVESVLNGPYYDRKMGIYFALNEKGMLWWRAGNITASGAKWEVLLPSSVKSISAALLNSANAIRLVTEAGCYERAFNILICKKYPAISVAGLKTFVRQQIS